MSNEATVSVYNRQSAEARDILAQVSSDDIGQEVINNCTLKVRIKNAFWEEQRLPSGFHRAYLTILGEVQDMFLEENDDRYFPCGSKSMSMMTPQSVKLSYIPSTSELQDVVNRGLYYKDFGVPEHLIDNTMEIPADIIYTCIYDTPVGMVEIIRPYEIQTSTKANHYDGFFNGCQVSALRALEDANDEFVYSFDSVAGLTETPDKYESVIKYDFYDDKSGEPVVPYVPEREKSTDEAIVAGVEDAINKGVAEARENRERSGKDRTAIRRFVDGMRQRKQMMNNTAVSRLASVIGIQQPVDQNSDSNASNNKLTYADIKAGVEQWNKEQEERRERNDESGDAAENVDRALDNQALNAGNTNIAGFGAVPSGASASEQVRNKADEKSGKKSQDNARRTDTALDNQALNRGETDIAGFGSSTPPKKNTSDRQATAADVLRNLLGNMGTPSNPNDDSPNYSR